MDHHERSLRSLPIWHGLLAITPLKGGVSNASFVVEDRTGKYVARIGHDYPFHQVSRAREAEAARAAHEIGLSPKLIYAADGVMVVPFITAHTYGEADVRKNWQRCLEMIMRCHRDMARHIRGQGAIFWVFQILRDYAQNLRAGQHRCMSNLPKWMNVVDDLEKAQVPLPVIFGHHDLLPTNFMDDGARLWLIDWEYGAFGTAMFDLANMATANSFAPELEVQMLANYFGGTPDLAKTRGYFAMKVAAALREAMWGMVSELHLSAPGVDYVAYAAEYTGRFEAIHARYKKDFL